MAIELHADEDRDRHLAVLRAGGFDRIADKIEMMWGSAELDRYFRDLMIDQRGDRAGFPDIVFETITELFVMNNLASGGFKGDAWVKQFDR